MTKKVVCIDEDDLQLIKAQYESDNNPRLKGEPQKDIRETAVFFAKEGSLHQFEEDLKKGAQDNRIDPHRVTSSCRLFGLDNRDFFQKIRGEGETKFHIKNFFNWADFDDSLKAAGYEKVVVTVKNADGTLKKPKALVRDIKDAMAAISMDQLGLQQKPGGRT